MGRTDTDLDFDADVEIDLSATACETQTLVLSESRLQALRTWAVDGTGVAAGARVYDDTGRIVLIKNSWTDGWFVPGGKVEHGEHLRAAAKREVREETGLTVTVGEPVVAIDQRYCTTETTNPRFRAAFVVYAAQATGTLSVSTPDGDEITAARWFETLPELHDSEYIRPYL